MNQFLIPIFLIIALSAFSCRSSRKIVFFGDSYEIQMESPGIHICPLFSFRRTYGSAGSRQEFEKRFEAMKTRLALTDDQATKVKNILKIDGEAWAKNREKFGDDREAMMKASQERGTA